MHVWTYLCRATKGLWVKREHCIVLCIVAVELEIPFLGNIPRTDSTNDRGFFFPRQRLSRGLFFYRVQVALNKEDAKEAPSLPSLNILSFKNLAPSFFGGQSFNFLDTYRCLHKTS